MKMTRQQARKIKRTVRYAWEWIKLIGVISFAMMAGAACYHQYLTQNHLMGEKTVYVERLVIEREPEQKEEVQEEKSIPPEDVDGDTYLNALELMALCVEAEAGNQDLTGKRMVADVILNRVDDADWPDTIEEVISQPYQFSSFWDGGMERASPSEETYRAVQMELEERGWPGLFYFTAEGFSEYGTPWRKVGDHYFSTK